MGKVEDVNIKDINIIDGKLIMNRLKLGDKLVDIESNQLFNKVIEEIHTYIKKILILNFYIT